MDPFLLSLVVVVGIVGGATQLRPPSGGGLGRIKRLRSTWRDQVSFA